jgi:hypothetical protein
MQYHGLGMPWMLLTQADSTTNVNSIDVHFYSPLQVAMRVHETSSLGSDEHQRDKQLHSKPATSRIAVKSQPKCSEARRAPQIVATAGSELLSLQLLVQLLLLLLQPLRMLMRPWGQACPAGACGGNKCR